MTTSARRWFGTLGLLCLAMTIWPLAQTLPVQLFVFTAEAKYIDAGSKARAETFVQVRQYLKKKKKTIVLVPSAAEAEVTLEILARDFVPTGQIWSFWTGFLGGPEKKAEVFGQLSVGDEYSTGLIGRAGARSEGRSTEEAWRDAAQDLADKVEEWVKDNARRVPRK